MQVAVAGGLAHEAYAYTGGKPFDPNPPCVVFVHGALHDHSIWTLLARWYANHGYGVLAPDLPGHSNRGDGTPLATVEAIADWLNALLDAANVASAAIVGLSMGSLVALEAAARRPERTRHLVMMGTAYPMTVSPALLDAARRDPLAAIDSVNAFSHSTIAAKPAFPGPGSWLHGGNRVLMRRLQAARDDTNLFVTDFEACNRYRGALEAATRVRCPATVIVGKSDQMTLPAQAIDLAAALKARVVTLPSGHSLTSEVPDLLLGALIEALPRR
ncbi:MAG: alpha/beta hydrolase [Caldimonas sp.]